MLPNATCFAALPDGPASYIIRPVLIIFIARQHGFRSSFWLTTLPDMPLKFRLSSSKRDRSYTAQSSASVHAQLRHSIAMRTLLLNTISCAQLGHRNIRSFGQIYQRLPTAIVLSPAVKQLLPRVSTRPSNHAPSLLVSLQHQRPPTLFLLFDIEQEISTWLVQHPSPCT
jgi:hypothetical protein